MQSPTTTSANAQALPSPSQLYGALFAAVQDSGLFADSKTFADAIPLRDPAAIAADFVAGTTLDGEALREFVTANFALPDPVLHRSAPKPDTTDLAEHIASIWSRLERFGAPELGSAIGLRQPFVVPGGRFRELYYWDSYFTMLGLAAQGRQGLVEDMIDLFAELIERFGHVPNGTRSYYLSRSQPPVFYLMVALSRRSNDPKLVAAMRREYEYWMSGGRAIAMPDGTVLNCFWDDLDCPRDESWAEDVATARGAGRPNGELWRDIRAGAESGWDFSSRWLKDNRSLATIRTTRIVPCCLNALLYGLECALADAGVAGMADAAERRRAAIARYTWNDGEGFFADYLMDEGAVSDQPTAAMLYPLFTHAARTVEAQRTIAAAHRYLLAPGGLRTTLLRTGEQWDAPNGWAPLQWIGCHALENYGEHALSKEIGTRWIGLVTDEFRASGRMLEKYDVEIGGPGGGGEYETQEGFGWTNGVTVALVQHFHSSRPPD